MTHTQFKTGRVNLIFEKLENYNDNIKMKSKARLTDGVSIAENIKEYHEINDASECLFEKIMY